HECPHRRVRLPRKARRRSLQPLPASMEPTRKPGAMRRSQRSFSASLVLSPCPPVCDPDDVARERVRHSSTISVWLLGARFRFASDSAELLRLVSAAYEGLPQHRWPASCEFLVELHLLPRNARRSPEGEPPPLHTYEMDGSLCGVIDACNYVLVMPARRRALVVASVETLEHAQHLRQELIEFAVFILATRA